MYTVAVTPLCLPEINNIHYNHVLGIISGFGYSEGSHDMIKSYANSKKLEERKAFHKYYDVISSTQCMEKFGRDWVLRRKASVDEEEGTFFWMEK